jgi:hypothetical protein
MPAVNQAESFAGRNNASKRPSVIARLDPAIHPLRDMRVRRDHGLIAAPCSQMK